MQYCTLALKHLIEEGSYLERKIRTIAFEKCEEIVDNKKLRIKKSKETETYFIKTVECFLTRILEGKSPDFSLTRK